MALNTRSAIDPRWFEWVRGPSRGFETARVEIIDPNTNDAVPYDPVTNTGGESVPTVVWPTINTTVSNAWVEVLSGSSATNNGVQATDVSRVRVHIDLAEFGPTEVIRPGFQVRVVDGGRDAVLESLILVIRKMSVGNLAVQRTLDCTIDEKATLG